MPLRCCLALALVARAGAVASCALEDPPAHRPGAASVAAAKKAIAEGKHEEALTPLRLALAADPGSLEVLALFVDACANDDDARSFWQHALARAATGPGGALALDAALKKRLATDDPRPAQLATARAAAVEELVKLAREREKDGASKPEALLVARWARRAALDLAQGSPALLAANADALSPRLGLPDALPARVVRALEVFAGSALANTRTVEAVEAARILSGLAAQIGFGDDLQGPKPAGVGGLAKSAGELLGKARGQLANSDARPWTVEELQKLDADQAEAFTRAHDTFGRPGVATSPGALYRIETDCGHATLLGVAETVELHHRRLAGWYGTDPFEGRPGLVRIVSEASGLEAEGAPFWWAGGFQGGDTTTLRFSCGGGAPTIEGLGHGLTHELTHRFDGALFPGIPAWLAEGKAVWTGAAFGAASSATFVERYASLGTIEAAYIKGYGDPANLTKLVDGTLDDYRDNYTAGNALYVYLRSRKDAGGRVLFRERLDDFQKKARGPKKGKELFVASFCDGREGRPKTFEEFCVDWTPWIGGFYWQARKPWALEFTQDVGGADSPPVLDEPVWVWSKNRAEPRFGQDEAVLAGTLFARAEKRADAIAAYVWALAVDGRRPAVEHELVRFLDAENKKDAAWCLRIEPALAKGERTGAPPFKSALPRAFALLDALGAAATDANARALPIASAALRADRERLARWLGAPALSPPLAIDPVAVDRPALVFDGPPCVLARGGWTEAGLTGYEERRAKGRHHVDEDGNLVVGLDKPKAKSTATGAGIAAVDRAAAQIDCFALAPEWVLPGSWRLDCRVRFLTSFVGGAVILGYRERDDNVRFQFSAGDFNYAIGASEKQEHDFESLGCGINGLRDRDGGLIGGHSAHLQFESPRSSFWLSLVVDGALVRAFVDGRPAGQYVVADGASIEGQIGFATSMGVMRIEDARLSRLERGRLAPAAGREELVFDLDAPRSPAPWDAVNVPSRGLPCPPQGALLVFVPAPETPLATELDQANFGQRVARNLRELSTFTRREQPTQPIVIALPAGVDAATRASIENAARAELAGTLSVRTHVLPAGNPEAKPDAAPADGKEPAPKPVSRSRTLWLAFLDQAGTVRSVSRVSAAKAVDDGLVRWTRVFREHGRPKRELPPFEREKQ